MKKENTTNNQIKFSKNAKLQKALASIYEDLQKLGNDEVVRYKKEFRNEPDFNIAQYGNLIIYFEDVRNFYKSCGYKSFDNMADGKMWDIYLRQVGYIARHYFN